MQHNDLLTYRTNVFSQNGEDGIIQYIFGRIGSGSKICCEFGAWDGVHLSNCRNLVVQGWKAIMIESDKKRYVRLRMMYADNPSVRTVHRFVDAANNKLDDILRELNVVSLDFLNVDIDGLDYQIFESLDIRPSVICIEVCAGHDPQSLSTIPVDVAKDNVGQPLAVFDKLARDKVYNLVCYTGNAFFVLRELCRQHSLQLLPIEIAYANYLKHLTTSEKEWLYLANIGIVPPYYCFNNPYLNGPALGISPGRSVILRSAARAKQYLLKKARSIRDSIK